MVVEAEFGSLLLSYQPGCSAWGSIGGHGEIMRVVSGYGDKRGELERGLR